MYVELVMYDELVMHDEDATLFKIHPKAPRTNLLISLELTAALGPAALSPSVALIQLDLAGAS